MNEDQGSTYRLMRNQERRRRGLRSSLFGQRIRLSRVHCIKMSTVPKASIAAQRPLYHNNDFIEISNCTKMLKLRVRLDVFASGVEDRIE